LYTDFKVRSRNPYDSSGNTLSNWSPTANARNTPPTGGYTNDYYIPASQVSQSTDGLGVITINTRIKDAQRHISSLESFAYSIDGGSRWYTPMNEDQSASLSGSWPNNHGQGLSSEADFSGPVYSFTFDTRHADVAGFNNSYKNNVKIRFLVNDGIDSSTTVTTTAAFAVDDLSPARSTTVEVVSQPQAGSTTIRACGSFTEVNPASNLFYVGISGMDYGSSTSGEGGTASPATCEVNVNTLDGNDYISKIKIIATDYYGNQGNNENTSPAATYKYVKPYTPQRPDATNPTLDSVEITVRKATAEADNLEYCIYATREDVAAQYVQADGLLGDTPVWQTISNWGTDGTITVWPTILPATYYTFQAKSRNSSDTAHQSSSESNFSEGVRGSSSSTPEVISYSPTADAIGVDLMPPITAVFSEKMLSDSIGFATSLTAIRDNSGNTISISVTGEVSYNTETKTASFVPAESLLYGYTYTFRIDTLATNLVGTPLPSVFSINFSTICSSDESNTTISTDGIVWLIAPSGTLPQNGYFRINRDPVHSPTLVDPAEITAANEKAIAEGNPYHYPIESTITENIAYATAESVISDLNRNVTIRIYYTDNNEDGFVDGTSPQIRARDLLIYRLNETSALWVRVPTSVVNTSDHYVYASVPRLGTYVIMSTPATDASNAYAYPVPFKPSAGHTTITFTNLPAICTIKIYTIAGELVKTISVNSSSGQTTWDGKTNFGGNTASGVYLYLIESSSSKKTGKLIIIR
jgi:hypothetical protein